MVRVSGSVSSARADGVSAMAAEAPPPRDSPAYNCQRPAAMMCARRLTGALGLLAAAITITTCMLYTTTASAQDIFVLFICEFQSSAIEVAINMKDHISTGDLPDSCSWVYDAQHKQVMLEKVLPEPVAHDDNGLPIFVGYVSNQWIWGWSAGRNFFLS